ncbi:hypothetical protein ACS5PK_13300 [Roseateles sp. DB2]|uniref:hypothetical protein n=1 Tax=Roseateles sp. DB2 TaxID=3453717 RepID=UPI003EE9CA4C
MTLDPEGNLLIADSRCARIWKLDAVTNLVSALDVKAPCVGSGPVFPDRADCEVTAFARDRKGMIAFAVSTGHILRLQPDGTTISLAGKESSAPSFQEFRDGNNATFKRPDSMAFDDEGNLYVADTENARIRKVTPSGYVSTVMGTGVQALRPGLNGAIGKPRSLITLPGNRLAFISENAIVTDGP